MSLFFGCRKPSDRLYEKELAEAVDVGALSHTYTAYSRSTAMPKVIYPKKLLENIVPTVSLIIGCKIPSMLIISLLHH